MPDYPIKGKYYLAKRVEEMLFDGEVVITEKLDGANAGIFRKDGETFPQKKGNKMDMSHPQFTFFKNQWMYENMHKIEKLPDNIVVYGELLRCVHTVKYENLPDWFLVFDIYDLEQERYLSWSEITAICEKAGLHTVPLIYEGKMKKKDLTIPERSHFGGFCEGVVVKNNKHQVRGKYVKPDFVKAVCDSKFWRDKKIELNKVV